MLARRRLLALAAATLATPAAGASRPLTVYKAWGCTCCDGWVGHMRKAGFAPKVVETTDLGGEWRRRGIATQFTSCHMGLTGGYVVVGHVPPVDVLRLLKERPKALGLSVPGMPDGSPGMERPDGRVEAYQTLLLLPGGRTAVFARHG
jgi:hypothetical protein